jgi:hypothetical protein
MQLVVGLVDAVCDDEVARERLERDLVRGEHPAGNRTFALYQSLKAEMVPLTMPGLVLDTGKLSLEECLGRCLDYLAGG